MKFVNDLIIRLEKQIANFTKKAPEMYNTRAAYKSGYRDGINKANTEMLVELLNIRSYYENKNKQSR